MALAYDNDEDLGLAASLHRANRARRPRPPQRVYFIKCECAVGYVKIGVARDPLSRLRDLQTASPYPLKLLHDMAGGEKEEQDMHARFYPHHHRGEWFRPGPDLLEFIGAIPKPKKARVLSYKDHLPPSTQTEAEFWAEAIKGWEQMEADLAAERALVAQFAVDDDRAVRSPVGEEI